MATTRSTHEIVVFALLLLNTLAWSFTFAGIAQAVTVYPPGALLQPEDVTSSHIRNDTIVDADVSASADISATKVAPRGTQGTVLLTDGTKIATTSLVTVSTTTPNVTINATTTLQASTTINGTDYYWPDTQGAANEFLQNDGSGKLSWSTADTSVVSSSFTAGETITAGDAVSVGDGQLLTEDSGADSGSQGFVTLTTTAWSAFPTTTPADLQTLEEVQWRIHNGTAGSRTGSFTLEVQGDSAGDPDGVAVASASDSNTIGASTYVDYVFDFNDASLSGNTQYWFVLKFTSGSGTQLRAGETTGTNNLAKMTSNSGSSWSNEAKNAEAQYTYTTNTGGRVYKASAAALDFRYNGFLGLARSGVSAGQTVSVDMLGISTATTSATSTTYYLGDTQGALSTSAGSNSLKVGMGLGSSFLLRPDNP